MKKILLSLVLVLGFLNGCSSLGALRSAPDFTMISVGMAKDEVVERLGRPTYLSAMESKEMLVYEWDNRWDGAFGGMFAYIGLDNGKVVGFFNDFQRKSNSFNMVNAWTQIQSADRTIININQNNR